MNTNTNKAELCSALDRLTATMTPTNPGATAAALEDLSRRFAALALDAVPYMFDYWNDRATEARNHASLFRRQAAPLPGLAA
jgi:hypothetical protein